MPEESVATRHKPGTYLAFDYGQRRIGVASGNTISRSANPLTIITSHKNIDWKEIEKTINEWLPVGFVVGMPYTADGKITPHLKRIKNFAAELEQQFKLPVYFIDEHLSSHAAKDLLSQSTSRRIRALDDTAAAVILQTWFDGQYDDS